MLLLIAFIGIFIIGFIVFGGGQVFMPVFQSIWKIMDNNGANIHQEKVEHIFTVSNSTPGVFGTKLAAITGYLAGNGHWYGWFAMLITFLLFLIPSMIMIFFAFKGFHNLKKNNIFNIIIKYLRIVVSGIMISIAISLFISTTLPFINFNNSTNYMSFNKIGKANFFKGWRLIVLIPYVLVSITLNLYLYFKKNHNLVLMVPSHIIVGLIFFEPWLL